MQQTRWDAQAGTRAHGQVGPRANGHSSTKRRNKKGDHSGNVARRRNMAHKGHMQGFRKSGAQTTYGAQRTHAGIKVGLAVQGQWCLPQRALDSSWSRCQPSGTRAHRCRSPRRQQRRRHRCHCCWLSSRGRHPSQCPARSKVAGKGWRAPTSAAPSYRATSARAAPRASPPTAQRLHLHLRLPRRQGALQE